MDIKDTDEIVHTEAPEIARVMAEHFFPKPVVANTSEIAAILYPRELENISDTITSAEVKEILGKLPRDKAPGTDGIPNRLLKECKATLS